MDTSSEFRVPSSELKSSNPEPGTRNSEPRPVGILCALPRELGPLIARPPAGCVIVAGGIGPEAAARAARRLLAERRPDMLISAGYAGGLAPPAVEGAIVVDTSDARIAALLPAGCARGRIAHTARMIRSADARRSLAQVTGAIAVDMESRAVAEAAHEAGAAFAAIRAITDGPEANLAVDWDRYRRPDGGVRIAAAVWGAVRTPGGIAELQHLWYSSREATLALTRFLTEFLERARQPLAAP